MCISSNYGNHGKMTQPVQNCGATLAELTLFFTEELKDELA